MIAYRIPRNPGKKSPDLIYVVVEIPKGSCIKYEINIQTGILYLDRILPTSVAYPCNYGFVPNTLESNNVDPIDVFVMENEPLFPFSVISVRPVGVILTQDQDGEDNKIIAIPDNCVDTEFASIRNLSDIPPHFLKRLEHFIKHHKDLEEKKFVHTLGWKDRDFALTMISESIGRFLFDPNK